MLILHSGKFPIISIDIGHKKNTFDLWLATFKANMGAKLYFGSFQVGTFGCHLFKMQLTCVTPRRASKDIFGWREKLSKQWDVLPTTHYEEH